MPLTIVTYGVYLDKGRVAGKDTGNERAERGKSIFGLAQRDQRRIPEIPGVRDQHQIVPVVCSCTKQLNPFSGNAPIGQRAQFCVG